MRISLPSRRRFLRAAGVSLALPLLESFHPPSARAATAAPVRRMVCICTTLGIHPEAFFPASGGPDYPLSPYLEILAPLRKEFTLFSGISHPEVDGGHLSESSFLTGAPHPGSGNFRNTISVDQLFLEKRPPPTRHASLILATGNASGSISISRSGIMLPSDTRPSLVFRKLFIDGSPQEIATQTRRLQDGQSILDTMLSETRQLQGRVSARDRERLDDYFTNVRDVEQRLHSAEEWARKPKPRVEVPPPVDIPNAGDFAGRTRLMLDLAHLALQTDSTRVITLRIQGSGSVPPIPGVTQDWHNLSHHGKDPEKIAQLKLIETTQMRLLAGFLTQLKEAREGDASVLDDTLVLYGSNLGNASSHTTRNIPMILAGGGFRHGQYLAGDPQNNVPACRIFVSMLQRMGLDLDSFSSGVGPMKGLVPS